LQQAEKKTAPQLTTREAGLLEEYNLFRIRKFLKSCTMKCAKISKKLDSVSTGYELSEGINGRGIDKHHCGVAGM